MERDAVCRDQYHGWLKENVGSHIVRRCHIHHSTMGIWCDWQAQGTRITQNLLHDNYLPDNTPKAPGSMPSQDLFVEVGHGPTLIDNNIMLSKASIRIATQGIACVHNLIAGSFTAVGGGTDNMFNGVNQPRYTPYHIPHRTEMTGFMSILHGDDRFYNNIFIQNWPVNEDSEVGTAVFDEYPTYDEWIVNFELGKPVLMLTLRPFHFGHLPVWVNGNTYFNGAKAYIKEKTNWVDNSVETYVKLVETNGKFTLDTNIYELLGEFKIGVINSDILGCAFEPEQSFENPDGSAIISANIAVLQLSQAPSSLLKSVSLISPSALQFYGSP